MDNHISLCKENIYKDYKQMFRDPAGGALIYPYRRTHPNLGILNTSPGGHKAPGLFLSG
ncbi:MAG: hypothetical protein NC039_08440 [Muribaculaceae bacterium]|nr:hypothetical protein [Muribaculaceae bacterium]